MKKLFVNPEIKTAEISQVEAIMASGNLLVDSKKNISYSATDSRVDADKFGYWMGK